MSKESETTALTHARSTTTFPFPLTATGSSLSALIQDPQAGHENDALNQDKSSGAPTTLLLSHSLSMPLPWRWYTGE